MPEGRTPVSSLPLALAQVLGPEAEEGQARIWAELSPAQRGSAVGRLEALEEWSDGRGGVDVAQASAMAGVSVSRFYRIAAEWRDAPSLSALGVFAHGRTRRPKVADDVVERLATAARQAALLHGGSSVSALVERTVALARLPADARMPGATKLREIVQAEKRRVESCKPMGMAVLLDCVATSLPREDGRPHIAFLVTDEGTGAVLGIAPGVIEDVMSGYAAAAADALRSIEDAGSDWRWSNAFSVMRITAGEDVDAVASLVHCLNAAFRHPQFILERGAKRYGRLIGGTVGPRMPGVAFTPTRTVAGFAMAANGDMTPWTDEDARAALRRAADRHNQRASSSYGAGDPSPPPELLDALVTISRRPG
jgi:hypothetical protein